VMTLIFYFTTLDLDISRYFYEPDGASHFPAGDQMPWKFFNENDDLFIYVMLVLVIVMLVIGLVKRRYRAFLVYSLYTFVSVLVGPILIVNVLLKGTDFGDYYIGWSRPRPREIIEFGGFLKFYRVWEPAFLDGLQNTNSSFPSGHVTVGAMYIVLFFVFNNPEYLADVYGGKMHNKLLLFNLLKWSSFILSAFLSLMLSISRIAAGAHFASDTIYSVVFTWVPAAILYYFVFRIPRLEKKALEKMRA
ncbi:MAG: phosphatase PAP2 family protein, partial [Promethearchaeota archaeon]